MDKNIHYCDENDNWIGITVKSFYEMILNQKPIIKYPWTLFKDMIEINDIKDVIIFYLEKYMKEIIFYKGYYKDHQVIQEIISNSLRYHDKSLVLYFISKHPGHFHIFSQIMRESHDDDNYEILVTMWDRLPLAQLKSEYDEKDNELITGHLDVVIDYIIPNRNIKMLRFIYNKLPQYAIDRLTTEDFFLRAVRENQLEMADIILSYASHQLELTEYIIYYRLDYYNHIESPIGVYSLCKDKIKYLLDLDSKGIIILEETFINSLLNQILIFDEEQKFDILIDRIEYIDKEQIEKVACSNTSINNQCKRIKGMDVVITKNVNKYTKRCEELKSKEKLIQKHNN